MRILGFSKKWDKLKQPQFTTFRFPRADKDWTVGEQVRVVIRPRSKGGGEKLGLAEFISREAREFDKDFHRLAKGNCAPLITEAEAIEDGFVSLADMIEWMEKTYGCLDWIPCMDKLTLKWV